jgi:type III secretion apparatus needle protein
MSEINLQKLHEDGLAKLSSAEISLKEEIDALNEAGSTVDQTQMLQLQFQMQSFTLFVQTMATIQKELSDMLKAILAKF